MTTRGEQLAIWGSLGVALAAFAAAGGMWTSRVLHAPPAAPPSIVVNVPAQSPPSVIVQAPKPYVCTPEQAEAGECLPKTDKPLDIFATKDGRHVKSIDVDMKREPHTETSMGPRRAKKKPKPSNVRKLKRDWQRAEQSFPFIFNMR